MQPHLMVVHRDIVNVLTMSDIAAPMLVISAAVAMSRLIAVVITCE